MQNDRPRRLVTRDLRAVKRMQPQGWQLKGCTKCGGDIRPPDEEDERYCNNCGKYFPYYDDGPVLLDVPGAT